MREILTSTWSKVKQRLRPDGGRSLRDENQPLRLELLSADQREQHGRLLAGFHRLKPGRGGMDLIDRLEDNQKTLGEVHDDLVEDIQAGRRITAAGEWLLDNYYVVEDQILTARNDFPRKYSHELPHLSNSSSEGLPRVYDIALETISHCDGRIEVECLSGVVTAYQSVTPLKLGELWAVPIMLRLGLIENLRRVAVNMAQFRNDRLKADYWLGRMAEVIKKEPKNLILVMADMAKTVPDLSCSFVAELSGRLHSLGTASSMPLNWLEQRLSGSGTTIEEMVRTESQLQAASQMSVSNCLSSLRNLEAIDWRAFVEEQSRVERILASDPANIYYQMKFNTRDRYRHVVEALARKAKTDETAVAEKAVNLASAAGRPEADQRRTHVGYYLIDEGLPLLEKELGLDKSPAVQLRRAARQYAFPIYLGFIVLITAVVAASLMTKIETDGGGWVIIIIGTLLSLICGSQLAVAVTNWLSTLVVIPRPLPRLDFSKGIPVEFSTLVVVPTMLTSPEGVERLFKDLEVRCLGNQDRNISYGLLTDFADSETETRPEDEALLNLARQKTEELNHKYARNPGTPFYLFHRPRMWNEEESAWMGFERKRGKLSALNRLILSGQDDDFSLIVGDRQLLPGIKYIITLDTDTKLPLTTARNLIGAMAHPLNQPVVNETLKRVTSGYGLLQPQVGECLGLTSRSLYAWLCASQAGIDPYTQASSDVYQDLFDEGSFIGKGIYDVEVFEKVTAGRLPDNRILSHDLLEGCYVRSGLLSDIRLYEQHPSHYSADVSRKRRWIRGDWQIASWLAAQVPSGGGEKVPNPLSALSRWKILDNLRRSLTPAALLFLLIMGWVLTPSPWFWLAAAAGIILIPTFLEAAAQALRKPEDLSLKQHFGLVINHASQRLAKSAFTLSCLPFEAYYSFDSIIRSLWRLNFSHQNLLQWQPFDDAERNSPKTFLGYLRLMWVSPALALVIMALVFNQNIDAVIPAGMVAALWLIAPYLSWRISRPRIQPREKLTSDQIRFLRRLARKTWCFFDSQIGPEDNWLPPDNLQEEPGPKVAHRTSPTNIGLSLLANLSAHDFGYISTEKLIDRSAKTFETLDKMERHRGHFFNWYDTRTLEPLPPRYISSVDSGNFAGHLMTLSAGLEELADRPILESRFFAGLSDTLELILENADPALDKSSRGHLDQLKKNLKLGLRERKFTLRSAKWTMEQLIAPALKINAGLEEVPDSPENQFHWWLQGLIRQCRDGLNEISLFAPWSGYLDGKGDQEFPQLEGLPTLRELSRLEDEINPALNDKILRENGSKKVWLETLAGFIASGSRKAKGRLKDLESLAQDCRRFSQIEYDFLYDPARRQLAIGYNVDELRRDNSFYDLLASEIRLAVFTGIAQGELPQASWFSLGRLLTETGGEPVLLSWSGSMFEYLMPLLVMPDYEDTLLDQSSRVAVKRQIEYARKHSIAWGISECGYNIQDAQGNYQYRAFGVPELGLQRGLAEDLVIAPYATCLALMVAPDKACRNLKDLQKLGLEAKFGFYEAADYTAARQPRGQTFSTVKSYMAHHQGMSLLAIAETVLDNPNKKRFMNNPQFQACLLLLQERVPETANAYIQGTAHPEFHLATSHGEGAIRVVGKKTPYPEVQLLSNGRYHVMISGSGGGYSRWNDLAVTRWREDGTRDNWGTFCYIKDIAEAGFRTATPGPVNKSGQEFEVVFTEGRAEFHSRDKSLDIHTEVVVSSEDDVEIRRVKITNRSRGQTKTLEITSFAELALARPGDDDQHPAFSKLFLQTEVHDDKAILGSRRPGKEGEEPVWAMHQMTVHGVEALETSFESDRSAFIGRTRDAANPSAMDRAGKLSGTVGPVLDPCLSVRNRINLEPETTVVIDLVTGLGQNRENALELIEKYRDRFLADRIIEMTWSQGQALLGQLGASEAEAQMFNRLAGPIVYTESVFRADPAVLIKNHRGQSGLWSHAVSGDLPIVLLRIAEPANIEIVRQLLKAHAYWRLKGLKVDLVIWNEDNGGYRQSLHDEIMNLMSTGLESGWADRPGGVFLKSAERISDEDRILFQTVARVILSDSQGSLADQLVKLNSREKTTAPPLAVTGHIKAPRPAPVSARPRTDLAFNNGLGGFTQDGREYVISIMPGQPTPAPWSNVLANPFFGTVISESGQGYTWSENAHEFRLTPWSNDPVEDLGGETFYLRDEKSGEYWSPTLLPCSGQGPYVIRHGFGYSVFEHAEGNISSELTVFVALDEPVKYCQLKVKNNGDRPRQLSATGYVEWVLGDLRAKNAQYLITELDPTGAVFARNPYNQDFPGRVAFFDLDCRDRTVTNDRFEFLGPRGSLRAPAAMERSRLSGRTGPGLDPCTALQVKFVLAPGQERTLSFRLGLGKDSDEARRLAVHSRGDTATASAISKVWQYWKKTLGTIHVETPDQSFNMPANGWLLYQTLACRFWGRSSIYQSGGAFGFRDQLQDSLALIYSAPELVRAHLIKCAAHQFVEGDVLHWWHPPTDRGVRTRCSDDYLWLPLVTGRYVETTGDTGVLDEETFFIQGRPLKEGEESYYDLPEKSDQKASLYEHCRRAIEYGLKFGEHGLPLIGSGDWNDGMDRVGLQGRGESVWLGFFLYDVLRSFSRLSRIRGDEAFADQCLARADDLKNNLDKNAWDGAWFRRAYFDDGTPLGSSVSEECRIDSISQSWAVISGAGDPDKCRSAMQSLDSYLVDRENGLIRLLTPPFDKSKPSPGYIRGYVPGVRENGGQYTHAAIWAVMAWAKMGQGQKAWELFKLINPVNHVLDQDGAQKYKDEPYVLAADVYGLPPHAGRGGWSWYTGSSSWMYQLMLNSLLGLEIKVDKLSLDPVRPLPWGNFKLHLSYKETYYHISVFAEGDYVEVDGQRHTGSVISLNDDRRDHEITIKLKSSGLLVQ